MEKILLGTNRGFVEVKKEGKEVWFNEEKLNQEQALECLWKLLQVAEEKINPPEKEDRSSELRELGIKADLQATAGIIGNSDLSEEQVKGLVERRLKTWN